MLHIESETILSDLNREYLCFQTNPNFGLFTAQLLTTADSQTNIATYIRKRVSYPINIRIQHCKKKHVNKIIYSHFTNMFTIEFENFEH